MIFDVTTTTSGGSKRQFSAQLKRHPAAQFPFTRRPHRSTSEVGEACRGRAVIDAVRAAGAGFPGIGRFFNWRHNLGLWRHNLGRDGDIVAAKGRLPPQFLVLFGRPAAVSAFSLPV